MADRRLATGLVFSFLFVQVQAVRADLVISEFLANPSGMDSPREYVELVATRDIDFAATPYSVVFANNGSATSTGWVAGGSKTYAFNIGSGTVSRGDVVYVGGSLADPIAGGGATLRAIQTGTTPGDGFGNASSGGVLGNGGTSADAIAIFNLAAGSITSSSVPVDGIFFGDAIGGAFVSPTAGFMLPSNDWYSGGRLQANSIVLADGSSGQKGIFSGTFDTTSSQWLSARSLSFSGASQAPGTTSISLSAVPEPRAYLTGLLAAILVGGSVVARKRLA